ARYSSRSASWVRTEVCRMPIASATLRASSSSPGGSEGETAVTARAREPSARAATAATSAESAPPEKATTAPPVSASTACRSRSFDESASLVCICRRFCHGRGTGRPPATLHEEGRTEERREGQGRTEQAVADRGVVVAEEDGVAAPAHDHSLQEVVGVEQ